MEIRTKTNYVCDISSMIERNRASPISGPWCSVILHPGSTLTIRFPVEGVDSDSSDEHGLQVLHTGESEAEVLPKDLNTLRQLKSNDDTNAYDEVLYNEALVGDALELDVSQMYRGKVKLKYHIDKPLSLREGLNSFLYHLTSIYKSGDVHDKIRAIVNVSFAFTHRYRIVGCDRGPQSVFDPHLNKERCALKSMGNALGSVYECLHDLRQVLQAGIHCNLDEELLPNDCNSLGYELYSNSIIPMPFSVKKTVQHPIRRFKLFDFFILDNGPVSYACICVDQRGYEKSKLTLEYNHEKKYRYTVCLKKESHALLPHILLPWDEAKLSGEEPRAHKPLMIQHSQDTIKIKVGTTLLLSCEAGLDVGHLLIENSSIHADPGRNALTWLPENSEDFYYTVNQTPDGPALVKAAYTDSLVTTPGGLEVRYSEYDKRRRCKELAITSHRGAILISKDPLHKKYVPIRYVCGKTPDASDLSVITGKMSAFPNLPTIGSLARYTWNVVKVNVETTDRYMQGCGVTYSSDELFKPKTPRLYDDNGDPQFGCKIDIQAAGEAAFYCPAPYVLDPPKCFRQVSVDGEVKNLSGLSQSLVASRSNHFVILRFDRSRAVLGETLRQMPPLECRCVTVKGIVLSTIHIENYYAK
ncbi:hypothetical protein, conserved [Babesia ovata]|uniref:6-Cys domain-containing protein n=1 Tax=Babesia ovata TaxID=189622 RepID=A0A2H6K772_9APIC|nr:uncharacterized protein BOVATA_003280 [Babesia ovata]GBE58835.1 hypothetical protein, conserved [Babesia ovata]